MAPAGSVPERGMPDGQQDAPQKAVEKDRAPLHLRDARHDESDAAHHRDEPPEEDGLATVLVVVALGGLEAVGGDENLGAGALGAPAPEPGAGPVARGVAEDRPPPGQRTHPREP